MVYGSVAFSRVFTACFVHSQWHLSPNSFAKIPELVTSPCSILGTVRTNAFVDHGGLPLRTAINWSRSSLRTPAVQYNVSWPPCISIWSYSHPMACCCLWMLSPVLSTFLKCASWAIFSVAAIVESQCTKWCVCCSCLSARGGVAEAPVVQLDSDWITPGWGACRAMTCYCRKGEEDDN